MNIFYPKNLPIFEHKQSIIETVKDNRVTIIEGETGSGKTTQIAKMCLEAFPDNKKIIGCTQPRRIAASTVAARVAEEMGEMSDIVGYKIRFHDHTKKTTKIKFMTDGVLLAETRQDPLLNNYSVIIIDEAHERNLNIDFLLGILKRLLVKRDDLKIIITSATIDTEAFSNHFDNAPIIRVEGRSYPVSVHYRPLADLENEDKDSAINHCVSVVSELFSQKMQGDILVFLATERDIRECCRLLEHSLCNGIILPMYGRLPTADQKKIFQTYKKTKVVIATNVAETSITVPGIRYVVDSGLARISHYNVRAKTTSLPICKISQSSCNQRKGRAGRLGPGLCIRLYDEEDYEHRDKYTLPEIKRSNLAEVILQMISLQLGDPVNFPFLELPFGNAINEGYRLLYELGAISDARHLTRYGRIMAELPIDPCISRILIEAKNNNCLREIKIIAAVLAIQDPRVRPANQAKIADKCHEKFIHPHSDFMIFLNIWNDFHMLKGRKRSWSTLKKYCKANFLSFQKMREWFDLHDQLKRILSRKKGFVDNIQDGSYEQIHKSLLAGFLRNIARKKEGRKYQGAHNKEVMVFPGSHQFLKSGQWLLAASFIETSNLYALTVATIEPDWIEDIAANLCNYSWSMVHWQKKTGRVVANESVSLYGLVISTEKRVNFAKRDRKNIKEARDIFIRDALVAGELKGTYPFLSHNLSLLTKWQEVEEKLRTRNIIVDDLTLIDFYANIIPENVYDQTTFNKFLKKKRVTLKMTDDDILLRKPKSRELADYPQYINLGNLKIYLDYHFEPNSEKDGVTYRLPVGYADSISSYRFDWLVPGLLHEKITFLLKSLPKSLRKRLIPISDSVNKLLDDIDIGKGSFFSALETSILKQFRVVINRSDWSKQLPVHLQPRFLLFDLDGREICSGRNLKKLLLNRGNHKSSSTKAILGDNDKNLIGRWNNSEHTTWDFAELPETIISYNEDHKIAGVIYPTLNAKPDRGIVIVSFENNRKIAMANNKEGMLFLYRLQFKEQYKALKKYCSTTFSGPSAQSLVDTVINKKETINKLLTYILRSIFGPLPDFIEKEETFEEKVKRVQGEGLFTTGRTICDNFLILLRKRRAVKETISKIFYNSEKKKMFLPDKKQFFNNLLEEIFPHNYLEKNSAPQFENTLRQLQSLNIRLERFSVNPRKDEQKEKQLAPHLNNIRILAEKYADCPGEFYSYADQYRLMVNELRISIFSPEIKTKKPVSAKKLEQLWRTTLTKC